MNNKHSQVELLSKLIMEVIRLNIVLHLNFALENCDFLIIIKTEFL